MLVLSDLEVKIQKKKIIKGMTLTTKKKGGVIGLLGPNGAGKTTLLNTLAGNIENYKGEFDIGDKWAFLPDSPFLYKYLTISECVDIFDKLYDDFDKNKAERLINLMNLNKNEKIKHCSKGMVEQIHIILTISRNVSTYLFDEPFASVDPLSREKLLDLLLNNRNSDSILLISTHLIDDIDYIFDEVIFMYDGEIIFHDDVKNALNEYGICLEKIYKEVMRNVDSN